MGRPVRVRFVLPVFLTFAAFGANAEDSTCASTPNELMAHPELVKLKDFFPEKFKVGYVNETAGSFFDVFVDTNSDEPSTYVLTFYTSGFLDLYGVMRTGPARFCSDPSGLTVHSMGQVQKIQIQASRLILGEGGPRKSFTRGAMPQKLIKLHLRPGSGGSRSYEKGFANPSQRDEH
ncbi:MAG: hypothetical protein J0L82_18065 [Deltaproteobacteria bacterium]|nr:hypothetical protein [Deltaproteobacteria bacterium]